MMRKSYDVAVIGGGLAGLSLAYHLQRETTKRVVLLERRQSVPPPRQKVGESSVQLAGYYFSKVLDLEEYLMHDQLMKYNLRFYWGTENRDNDAFEDYSQGYIRNFSNIASYQLDRNTFERELLRRCCESPRFEMVTSARDIEIDFAGDTAAAPEAAAEAAADAGRREPHRIAYKRDGERFEIAVDWIVDTTGRGGLLKRKLGLAKKNPIRHGAFFWWVEGLVDIDKLTEGSQTDIRRKPERRHLGHLPTWLATNHFMKEGLWFWVIPLRHKTSLGLVYDQRVVDSKDVFSVEKATAWVCENFPLFARDLPKRNVLDFGGYKDFSYDCQQTISADRWALVGEAGRFSDPLYSPGSDLIAIYNTLVVDAIQTDDPVDLAVKVRQYEQLMRAVYLAYEPTYATSYDALGDQEVFTLKYAWELTVYFAGYVFPFINDLFTDRRFVLTFLRLFARLGPLNQVVQQTLSDYFQWKRDAFAATPEPIFFDFMELGWLRSAEKTFYRVDVDVDGAKVILREQVDGLEEFARFIIAYVASRVVDDPRAMTNRRFVEGIDLRTWRFEPADLRARYAACADDEEIYTWSYDPVVLDIFRRRNRPVETSAPVEAAS